MVESIDLDVLWLEVCTDMNAVTWGAGKPRVSVRGTGGRCGRTPQVMPRKREWHLKGIQ